MPAISALLAPRTWWRRTERARGAWPADDLFQSVDPAMQLTDGTARLARVAFCDTQGRARREFNAGESIHACAEFEITGPIGLPGLLLHVTDGHACRVWRAPLWTGEEQPVRPGSLLRIRQEIPGHIAPGTWWLDVGLVSRTPGDPVMDRFDALDETELRRICQRHCYTRLFGTTLTVRAPSAAPAPRRQSWAVPHPPRIAAPSSPAADADVDADFDFPPLLHVTHWKAGSQWIYALLRKLFPAQIVPPQMDNAQIHFAPLARGRVYPTVYAARDEVERTAPPVDAHKLIVFRDPRDTLVSYYFSTRHSHQVLSAPMGKLREFLAATSVEQGMLAILRTTFPLIAMIQRSWLRAGEPILRYEDLLADDERLLHHELIVRRRLPITPEALRTAVAETRFERMAGGRKRGQEDAQSHYRKGTPGDWQNYFTPELSAACKDLFGDLLIGLGYERDDRW